MSQPKMPFDELTNLPGPAADSVAGAPVAEKPSALRATVQGVATFFRKKRAQAQVSQETATRPGSPSGNVVQRLPTA